MSTFIAPDGITWFEQTATTNLVNCWSMCYSPAFSKFFAVSYNSYSRVLSSSDGITWDSVVKGDAPGQLPKGWKQVVQGNVLVAVGVNGIMLSVDGLHWTTPNLPQLNYNTIEYSQELNRFVALTDTNAVVFSVDSNLTLTQQLVPIPTSKWSSIAYSPSLNRFVAVSYRGPISVMYSTNGINWTNGNLLSNLWNKIVWSPERGQFLAIANASSSNVGTSTDGINWTTVNNTTNYWRDLTWSPELGMFMMVSSGFGNNNSSTSGGTSFTTYKTRRLSSVVWSSEYQMFIANVVQTPSLVPSDLYNVLLGKQITPSPTPTMTVTPTATVTPTPSITASITPSATITPTPTVTATLTPSITVTATVTPTTTPSVTSTPTLTPSVSATITPSVTPTITVTSSITPTVTRTPTRTVTPTISVTPSDTITPMINAIRAASEDWWSFNDNVANNISGRGDLIGFSNTYEASPLGGKRLITSAVHSGPQSNVLNTTSFSIGGLVKVQDTALTGTIFGGYSNTSNGPTVALRYDGSNNFVFWNIVGPNNEAFTLSVLDIPINQWFSTMITVSGEDVSLYANGALMVTAVLNFTPRTNSNLVLNEISNGRIVGDVDEIYTFNRPLTSAEVNFLQGNGGKSWSPTFG
ncbi:hypothetical protein Xoosp13_331 [Xanthomonas phage Xoo-sp13]|nr:hypothetical protein Xoosp13_331 [Xanthomonas phage Xoo-sp13]